MDENKFYMTTKEMAITIIALVAAMTLVVSCIVLIVSTLS